MLGGLFMFCQIIQHSSQPDTRVSTECFSNIFYDFQRVEWLVEYLVLIQFTQVAVTVSTHKNDFSVWVYFCYFSEGFNPILPWHHNIHHNQVNLISEMCILFNRILTVFRKYHAVTILRKIVTKHITQLFFIIDQQNRFVSLIIEVKLSHDILQAANPIDFEFFLAWLEYFLTIKFEYAFDLNHDPGNGNIQGTCQLKNRNETGLLFPTLNLGYERPVQRAYGRQPILRQISLAPQPSNNNPKCLFNTQNKPPILSESINSK